ncbi:hypothetical protein PHYSODRAFT_558727 [Phytophthora sojae]|uniref:Uncharacterized protein n=1 Tax=Phytophthora sojae (strain P6497) TaxID=1094619 RepID=G4Z5Y3_PHYSP|nr:hypothetical protein PHYSODRAFT_558727 [Phytophthora sojae]EGZ20262.1 hypothetical protein PHYSODRAFT_558727 [Phytophthora sojae]|eukprot:XP_009522979.1 hypothetical protein PHYSODRAFT_558727 [Phytophthora sojae]
MTHLRVQTESKDSPGGGQVLQEDGEQSCCISCFRLIPSSSESLQPEHCESDTATGPPPHEPELLCASCIHHLVGKGSSKSPAAPSVGGVLSPLPKLSLLVKVEAKCQDQLQLLRRQQEILKQQRESLQATKRAKEEAIAAERELARQRRKHFLMIQERRKREEELKFQQFQVDEHTSRSEQEGGADKPKKKKPKPPKTAAETALQRRRSESAAGLDTDDASLPHVVEPASKHTETPHSRTSNDIDNGSAAETHSASLYERRRQMMACYSQDLSPLIDGRKPRRLPFPKPVAATSMMMKRRQTLDNNAQVTALATNHRSKSQHNARKQGKNPAPKTTKLRPLEEQKHFIKTKPHASNQFEEFHTRVDNDSANSKHVSASSSLSPQPRRRLADTSAPLTAEIKPASWAYELAKDVLPQDDPHQEVGAKGFAAPLSPLAEENAFTLFPLQRQLPSPTFPPSQHEPQAEAVTKAPRWEYSAERLSSLLEKYNVSVSAVTTATPK